MQSKHNVLEYLESSACLYPSKEAVVEGTRSCTYEQLQHWARKAGTALTMHDTEGRAVVVMLEKSAVTLAVFFGTLYAGGHYVPVDPSTPRERFAALLETLENPLVVVENTAAAAKAGLEGYRGLLVLADLFDQPVRISRLRDIRSRTNDNDAAYILFTSGSTGKPKGIAVSHRAIISFIDSFIETFGFSEADRFANQAPFDFDVSVKDIYASLAVGATLVVIPRALFSKPLVLVDYLNSHRATVLTWAVAALCLVTSFHALDNRTLKHLRYVLFSGEVMPAKSLAQWLEAAPDAQFANLYGPTEITCNCMFHLIDHTRAYSEGIPLGQAFPHCEVTIVDEGGALVDKPGIIGEILVSGPSLALGYVGNKKLTQQTFTAHPLPEYAFRRTYRTGDLACFSKEGELFFRGRKDNQIKRLGHRIELEEVDLAIEHLDGIDRCRCTFDTVHKRLIAFYEGSLDRAELHRQARSVLPTHMMPNKVVRVSEFPLNKNGKVDRHALIKTHTVQPTR